MKVLIVHPQMTLYGGAELVIVRLANYLQSRGHEVSILTLSTKDRKEYEGLNFILPEENKRIYYHLRGSLGALKDIYKIYVTLKHLCRQHADDFDVINAHNFPAIWAVPKGKKIVWMCNEVPDLWHNRKIPRLINPLLNIGRFGDSIFARCKRPKAVVADSRMAQIFRHRYCFEPTIIPYGIDGNYSAQSQTFSRDGLYIIQPSMISPSKNQMAVLEAAKELNAKVLFAGYREETNSYTAELDSFIAQNNVSATFTGHISREELQTLYHRVHVAVFTGRGQGSWLGPFEALSAGVPIVVSSNLSCSDLIRENDLGVVTDECVDLTNALRDIYQNYHRYQQQALKGREFVLRSLTWDKFGAKFLEVLRSA